MRMAEEVVMSDYRKYKYILSISSNHGPNTNGHDIGVKK